jgi:hypothetical protein
MAHCRYCHQTGHNRRTCPTLTERMKVRAEQVIAAGHPDHYFVKEYQERIAPKGKKASQQTCGYCEEKGHTRRKCDVLQKDKEWFAKHHNDHVRLAHDYIVNSPVGIGSLFKYKSERYDYQKCKYIYSNSMYILTEFNVYKNIVNDNMRIHATLTDPTSGHNHIVNLRDYVRYTNGGGYSSIILVSPEAQMVPSDWVFNQSTTVDALANHPHFRRSGRKSDDKRDWTFRERDRSMQIVEKYNGESSNAYHLSMLESAKKNLERYTVEYSRAKIFKDFKSEE